MDTPDTSVEYVVDSIRRVIKRWVCTQTPLTSDGNIGNTIIDVDSSLRFSTGDEVMIRNPITSETPVYINSIPDDISLELTAPLQFKWKVDENSIVEKTFNQMFIQGIYFGDPDNIPLYPAITVRAMDEASEWWSIDSTKETYNLEISIYVQDSYLEKAERFLIKTTNIIKNGLKNNIYPLVSPYETVSLIHDIEDEDTFIKVSDTSIFEDNSRIWIEDRFKVVERRVMDVVDSQTLELSPFVCGDFSMSDTTIINLKRFIFNSWPERISYGKVYKGTMLKAAVINWFAWEERVEPGPPIDTHF
jgi:hypothetical protein